MAVRERGHEDGVLIGCCTRNAASARGKHWRSCGCPSAADFGRKGRIRRVGLQKLAGPSRQECEHGDSLPKTTVRNSRLGCPITLVCWGRYQTARTTASTLVWPTGGQRRVDAGPPAGLDGAPHGRAVAISTWPSVFGRQESYCRDVVVGRRGRARERVLGVSWQARRGLGGRNSTTRLPVRMRQLAVDCYLGVQAGEKSAHAQVLRSSHRARKGGKRLERNGAVG